MAYTLFKLLAGGTYTTGLGLDWRTQFASATIISARPTIAGEILYPGSGSAFGILASYAFVSSNPFDCVLCIPETSVGAPVQIYVNGSLLSELNAGGTVTCSMIAGANVLEFVRSQAPLVVMPSGTLIDPLGNTGRWISLYPPGLDPFVSTESTVSATRSIASISL